MSLHGDHLVDHITHPTLVDDTTLHVVGVVSNPVRFHSRYRLFREWAKHVAAHDHVKLYLVESAFGNRQHECTDSADPTHLQVRTNSEIWNKESLINLGVRHLLPRNWKYVAWVDADLTFRDPSWALEAMHQLQHFDVVQPWQNALDLGPQGNVLQTFTSFGYLRQKGEPMQAKATEPYKYGHCGYAWACTRRFWEAVGGLMDWAILGSADYHMAWAMIGEVGRTVSFTTPEFYRRCMEWQARAVRVTHRQVGFVPGRIEHAWHGAKKNRYYKERWKILVDHKFNADRDIMHDHQGLVQLVGRPDLEQALRQYNRSRHEDSVEEG